MIGWLTNKIAIKMLFYPRNKIFGIQGLIPKRRNDISRKISNIIKDELISSDDIFKNINKEEIFKIIKESLLVKLDGIPLNHFVVDFLCKEIMLEFNKLEMNCEEVIDVYSIVENKINSFDIVKLENMVQTVAKNELKSIEIFGAIIGFLIGLLQLLFIY